MIEVHNLYYKYEDKLILKGINFKVKEGDFVAVIGHNGSGKTTLIKHFNGLLTPSKGDVLVDKLNTKNNDWENRPGFSTNGVQLLHQKENYPI